MAKRQISRFRWGLGHLFPMLAMNKEKQHDPGHTEGDKACDEQQEVDDEVLLLHFADGHAALVHMYASTVTHLVRTRDLNLG